MTKLYGPLIIEVYNPQYFSLHYSINISFLNPCPRVSKSTKEKQVAGSSWDILKNKSEKKKSTI